VRVPAGRVDHRGEILDLALDGIRLGVAAVAAAPAVVAVDGEARRQRSSELDQAGIAAVTERAGDQDQGVAVAFADVGDGGAVA
jgi:hypothetical protein